MADLIDRAAVLDYLDLREHDAEERDWRSGANEIARIRKAIAALPAQGVRVPEVEERKFYHDEWPLVKLLDARDLGNGLLTDDGEAWRYRLTHYDARGRYDVLYRPTRKIAALEPASGGVEAPAEDAAAKGETAGEMLDRLGMDGAKWAAEFRTTALRLGYSDMDEGWLIGWFCNAIMAGYDRAPTPAPVDALVKAAEAFDAACSNNAHGKTVWTGHHFIDAKELKAAWEATRAALAALRAEVEWWKQDDRAAWDKCEERRIAQEAAEAEAEKLRGASKALASWCVKNIQPNLEMDTLLHALDAALTTEGRT